MSLLPTFININQHVSLVIYFSIGIALCLFPLYQAIDDHHFRMRYENIEVINDEPYLLERVLTPLTYAAGFIFFVTIWPLALAYLLYQYFEIKRSEQHFEHHFYCAPEFIGSEINPTEYEKTYPIFDPIQMTPAKPFGLLYPAWKKFIASGHKNDTFFEFFIPKGSKTNRFNQRAQGDIRGVVKMRGKRIIDEFLIEGS